MRTEEIVDKYLKEDAGDPVFFGLNEFDKNQARKVNYESAKCCSNCKSHFGSASGIACNSLAMKKYIMSFLAEDVYESFVTKPDMICKFHSNK